MPLIGIAVSIRPFPFPKRMVLTVFLGSTPHVSHFSWIHHHHMRTCSGRRDGYVRWNYWIHRHLLPTSNSHLQRVHITFTNQPSLFAVMDEKSKYKQQLTCIRILEDDSYNVSVRKHRKPYSRPHAERVGGWAPSGADWARLPKCISCQDKDPEHCHFIGVYQSLSILEMQVSSLFSGCRMLESLGSGPTFSFPPAEIPCYPNLFNVPMSPKNHHRPAGERLCAPMVFIFFITFMQGCCVKLLFPLFERERVDQQRAEIIFCSCELSEHIICGECAHYLKI